MGGRDSCESSIKKRNDGAKESVAATMSDLLDVLRRWKVGGWDLQYDKFIDLMLEDEDRRAIFDELQMLCHSFRKTKEPRSMLQMVEGICRLWTWVCIREHDEARKEMKRLGTETIEVKPLFKTLWEAEEEFDELG